MLFRSEIVPIERCEIASERLNEALPEFRGEALRRGVPSKLELELDEAEGVSASWNSSHAARGFRQVHDKQNALLRGWVDSRISGGGILLDLYGGSGNLSIGLADRFERIHCVDVGAGRLAKRPGAPAVPGNLEFHSADVGRWATRNATVLAGRGPGACILDPPREGCGEALSAISVLLDRVGARELVSVGCDPDSWARDVSRFVSRGWRIEAIAFFDFFPQTVHFESVAKLVRV